MPVLFFYAVCSAKLQMCIRDRAMSEAGTMAAGVLVIVFLIAGGVLAVRGWNRLY